MTTSHRRLDWVPKPFRDGDLAGGGAGRLLGKTELSATEIMIRETAQNAWDARTSEGVPAFDIHLQLLDDGRSAALRGALGGSYGLGLDDVLAKESLRVLEISDRGTTGLDGPVEIGPVTGEDTQNFVDLILKVGVPRTDGRGGGTYGFGKTAAYSYSSCGTLVYWTRCRTDAGLEHRLIASAMGSAFHHEGIEYTGRHWWGKRTHDGRVLPLIGEEARALGEALFSSHFEEEQTGTSILVIDPPEEHLSAESGSRAVDDEGDGPSAEEHPVVDTARAFGDGARDALRLHLWPKMTPDDSGDSAPMRISLRVDGSQIGLGSAERGAWKYWSSAIRAIRKVERAELSPGEVAAASPVKVLPVTRYSDRLGSLAIVRRNTELDPPDGEDNLDPHNPVRSTGRLMLMRGQTELVVTDKDEPIGDELLGIDWLAVFKADPTVDAALASTEPPAHNDWLPGGRETEGEKFAGFLRRKLRTMLREELGSRSGSHESQESVDATPLANMLGTLLPGEPIRQKGTGSGGRTGMIRGRRGLVVLGHRLLREGGREYQQHMIDFLVEGAEGLQRVELIGRVASEDPKAAIHLDERELNPEWRGAQRCERDSREAMVQRNRSASVVLCTPLGRAVDLTLQVAED